MKKVCVMDNGAGNIMAYMVDLDAEQPSPKPLIGQYGEPAGFARLKQPGGYYLGDQLYSKDEIEDYRNIQSLSINFKAVPTPENRDLMVEYLRAWLNRIKLMNPSEFLEKEDAWIIGCPVGWRDAKTIGLYRTIYEDAGYINPVIVPESNAAMCYYEKTANAITYANQDVGVLCEDLGAYSNDGTWVRPGKVVSCGGFVGAALIEQALIELNLTMASTYCRSKNPYNPPELIQAIEKRYRSDATFHSFLLLHMRKTKEEYFNKVISGGSGNKDTILTVVIDDQDPAFGGHEYFTLFTNNDMVRDAIEKRKLRELLPTFTQLSPETQSEIADFTWLACLENYFRRVAEAFPEFTQEAVNGVTEKKPMVLMTGGASLMPFVQEVVQTVFPRASVCIDRSAVTTIAKGLAYFAPDKLRALAFDKAFMDILNETYVDEDGDQVSTIGKTLLDAYQLICRETIENIAEQESEAILNTLIEWSEHKCESGAITSRAAHTFESWYDRNVLAQLENDAKKARDNITGEINQKFANLLQEGGFDSTTLFAENELKINLVEAIREGLLGRIRSELVKEIQAQDLSFLPNPGRLAGFLITASRQEILNQMAPDLKGWFGKFKMSTYEWLGKIFLNEELVEAFMMEALARTYLAINEKKRSLLGDLVVEETVEETEEENGEGEEA